MSVNLEPQVGVFDPTNEVINFKQNRVLLRAGHERVDGIKHSCIKLEQNKNCGFSPIHYLGKAWQHIWRPCTRMKKVWNKMQADGIDRINREENSERKLKMYKNLCQNLTNFETQVINKHNERRFRLFKFFHLAGVRIKPQSKGPLNELKAVVFQQEVDALKRAFISETFKPVDSIKSGNLENVNFSIEALRLYANELQDESKDKTAVLLIAEAKELGINEFNKKNFDESEAFSCSISWNSINKDSICIKIGSTLKVFNIGIEGSSIEAEFAKIDKQYTGKFDLFTAYQVDVVNGEVSGIIPATAVISFKKKLEEFLGK